LLIGLSPTITKIGFVWTMERFEGTQLLVDLHVELKVASRAIRDDGLSCDRIAVQDHFDRNFLAAPDSALSRCSRESPLGNLID